MDEDEWFRRHGLRPADLDLVRELLAELSGQGWEADTLLMRLCCIQLFNAGLLDDVLRVWDAKESSFDAHCSIDVQLLCGAGLVETKTYLAAHPSPEAADALEWLLGCEETGDFEGFSVAGRSEAYARHYRA
ncbi:hypothetical protein OG777_06020 [Micromonospora peucetia]|uniref:Uncharacterized protein n=1 Tax=Micromonospora peucetia TaxID=47871 RepID=A0A1C6UCC6_9ACTN|nr:hypothetical protein [Micromonospora peucetia]MCX4386485.1 hypothetical protein [Micromonospora peucetia]WSA33820.1 hypothetical protein OIE14_07160 [Micromonospora peucetia]SCL51682.1 hypothetical protein GA0070608_0893 [Micromonospora peucetia]